MRCTLLGAALATMATAPAAFAAAGPQGVRAGNNITVFHNIDMVVAAGHGAGERTQVDIFRGPHRIATARGAAVDAGEGGALEVNHGPEGAPQPGDCFEGATPDVKPGDRVVVSNPGASAGVDEAIVDNITITSRTVETRDAVTGGAPRFTDPIPPVLGPAGEILVPGVPSQALPTRQEVWLQGTAQFVNADGTIGAAIPINQLDSAEFLGVPDDNQLRMGPNTIGAGATAGTWIAKFWDTNGAANGGFPNVDRNRNNRSDAYIFNALATGEGHAMGYGHVDPLPPVSMLVDGLEEQAGPAPGCESAPKSASSAGTTSTGVLNIANATGAAADPVLTVGGWAAAATTAADVVLSNGATSVARPVTLSTGAGQKGWTAQFTKTHLAGLTQGTLTARLRIGGAQVGAAKAVLYDTVAPTFEVSHPNGLYTGRQIVAVSSASDPVTFEIDGGPPVAYTGQGIELGVGDHTVLVRSVDAAGNATQRVLSYTVQPPPVPPVPPAPQGDGSGSGGASGGSGQSGDSTLGAATEIAGSLAAPAPVASRLSAGGRVVLGRVRRAGLTVRFTAPQGTTSAVIRVLRRRGRRVSLVGSRTLGVAAGRRSVRLRSAALRRKLAAGTYVVEVTLASAGRAGTPATAALRVTR